MWRALPWPFGAPATVDRYSLRKTRGSPSKEGVVA
jgi:hypothetical protein